MLSEDIITIEEVAFRDSHSRAVIISLPDNYKSSHLGVDVLTKSFITCKFCHRVAGFARGLSPEHLEDLI